MFLLQASTSAQHMRTQTGAQGSLKSRQMTHLDWKASTGNTGPVINVRTAATETACCRACAWQMQIRHDRRGEQTDLCCTLLRRQGCKWCLMTAGMLCCRGSENDVLFSVSLWLEDTAGGLFRCSSGSQCCLSWTVVSKVFSYSKYC